MLKLSNESNFTRTLAGLSLIVAPLLLLAATLIGPDLTGDGAERLAEIADNEARYVAGSYLFLVGAWVFVPGAIGLWRLFRGPRVTFGQIGAGLFLIGVITTIAFFGFGTYEYVAATDGGLDRAEMARLADAAEEPGVAVPLFIVFVLGVVIGSLIIAWSLWRRRLGPVWAAAAIAIGSLVSFFGGEEVVVSAIGFGLLLIGYGGVGGKLLSMSDDEWDRLGRTAGAP